MKPMSLRDRGAKPDASPMMDRRPHMAGAPDAKERGPAPAELHAAEAKVVEADRAIGDAQIAAIGKGAPAPAAPIPMDTLTGFIAALNEATAFLSDGKLPPLSPQLPSKVGMWNRPLPADVFATLRLLVAAIGIADPEKRFVSMLFDPMAAASTAQGMEDATGKLRLMARDADLKAAMQRPVSDVDPGMADPGRGPPSLPPEPSAPPPAGAPPGAAGEPGGMVYA